MAYLRHPCIGSESVVFVTEDDIWTVACLGGVARRLTFAQGRFDFPVLSPDGQWLAAAANEDGAWDVVVLPADGGLTKRLTWSGAGGARPVAWLGNERIVFVTGIKSFTGVADQKILCAVDIHTGIVEELPYGFSSAVAYGDNNRVALLRKGSNPAWWKRYRGGLAGEIWIDTSGSGEFVRILEDLRGNLASPAWLGERLYFVSDHTGIANVHSCSPCGGDVQQHTHHSDFFVRCLASGQSKLVYQMAADLHVLDLTEEKSVLLSVVVRSTVPQRQEKFCDVWDNLETVTLHPVKEIASVVTRGKLFHLGFWHGPVEQHGVRQGVRYMHPTWLPAGEEYVVACDAGGHWQLVSFTSKGDGKLVPGSENIGRPTEIRASPQGRKIAVSNYREELWTVDLDSGEIHRVFAESGFQLHGFDWSPDGGWLAFARNVNAQANAIFLFDCESRVSHQVSSGRFQDCCPSFSPKGDYLYFASTRDFSVLYSDVTFSLDFPRSGMIMALPLRADLRSPLFKEPKEYEDEEDDDDDDEGDKESSARRPASKSRSAEEADSDEEDLVVKVDLDDIIARLVALPGVSERLEDVIAIEDKVLFMAQPIETLSSWEADEEHATLKCFDLESEKVDVLAEEVSDFAVSLDRKRLLLEIDGVVRIVEAGKKPDFDHEKDGNCRKSGVLDLDRIRVQVSMREEWKQMFGEVWRLQAEHFWTSDMAGIDWNDVYARYQPLLDKVGSRSEFSDLVYEVHGELGTSHAYEFGGDYREHPEYKTGFLGADLQFDQALGKWRIERILRGDSWVLDASSPLAAPGLGIADGDWLLAIDGQDLSAEFSPSQALHCRAGTELTLDVAPAANVGNRRRVTIHVLSSEMKLRYRDWVEGNRRRVSEASGGRLGYIHIPDMGPAGFGAFFRDFVPESVCDGLVVDARFNRGGHVSELLLEVLSCKVRGLCQSRWFGVSTYPTLAPRGPLVALTNSFAGSDGDMFPHVFKMAQLGPLVGTRTWGGVVGIMGRHPLVDGSLTTQPEFAHWFADVGWKLENHGTEPDIHVESRPQDEARGFDVQLNKAIEVALAQLKDYKPLSLDGDPHPCMALKR